MTQTITVIRGDGIGPEIMDATLFILDKLGNCGHLINEMNIVE